MNELDTLLTGFALRTPDLSDHATLRALDRLFALRGVDDVIVDMAEISSLRRRFEIDERRGRGVSSDDAYVLAAIRHLEPALDEIASRATESQRRDRDKFAAAEPGSFVLGGTWPEEFGAMTIGVRLRLSRRPGLDMVEAVAVETDTPVAILQEIEHRRALAVPPPAPLGIPEPTP